MNMFKKCLALEHERITILSELPKALDFFYDATLTWEDTDWNTKIIQKWNSPIALVVVAERLEEVLGKVSSSMRLGRKLFVDMQTNWDGSTVICS